MLATKSQPFSMAGWIYELKYDGARLLVGKQGGIVQLMTRNKNDATTWFPEIISDIGGLKGDFILDCEVCVADEHGRSDFEALLPRLRPATRHTSKVPLVLHCFDLLFLNGEDLRSNPLIVRKDHLRKLIGVKNGRLLYVQHIEEKGLWLFEKAIEIGLEGIVAKKADSLYVGGRTRYWLKAKPPKFHNGFKRPGRGTPPRHPTLKAKTVTRK